MITSERQYKAAQEKLQMLETSLKAPAAANVPEEVFEAAQGQTKELAQEIAQEIREYESLREAHLQTIPIRTLDELFTAPTRYRIARHWTLEQFGEKVDKDWRQIKRYEDAGYQNVTVTTLREILQKLDFSIMGKVDLERRMVKKASAPKRSSRPPVRRGLAKKA